MSRIKKILSGLLALCMLANFVPEYASIIAMANSTEETEAVQSTEGTVVSDDGEIIFEVEETTEATETVGDPIVPSVELGENIITEICGTDVAWTYDLDSKTLVISGEGDVISMTYLTDTWKSYIGEVETIIVENGIHSLPGGLFENCTALKSLSLPIMESIDGETAWTLSTLIGDNKSSLVSLTVTSGTAIPDYFASGCTSLQEVTLADTITSIGAYAFSNCDALTSIVLPDSVTALGNNAFYGCGLLASVTLPASLETIGEYAFAYCPALTAITLPDSLKSIGGYAFRETPLTELTIPASVEQIGEEILLSVDTITSLTLPHTSLTSEYNKLHYLFYDYSYNYGYSNCELPASLTSVTITGGTKISDSFFSNCTYLTEINLPETLTEIGASAFSSCPALAEITLPSSLTTIGASAFSNCDAMTSIVLPDSVTALGNNAFYGCGLLASVTLPASLETIGEYAFAYCPALTAITLPDSLKSIGGYAFRETPLTELTIPASVEQIGEEILLSVDTITSLTLPHTSLTSEYNKLHYLFYDYSYNYGYSNRELPASLTSVTITGGTKITDSFFNGCTYLTEINLPETLTEIGASAFYNCTALADITIPDSVTKIGSSALSSTPWYDSQYNGVVYAGRVAYAYKGDMPENFAMTIADGTVGIANNAFYNMDNIVSVSFPESLVHIGSHAFYSCGGLTEVTFPASLISIGNSAFYDCTSNASITFQEGLESIGASAFPYNAITSVVIPDSVQYLGSNAFAYCDELCDVTMSDNIAVVGDTPFYSTQWFDNQEDGPVYIGKTFYGYKGTMPHNYELVIRDGTTAIADEALKNCIDLTSVTLPDTLESIGSYAFYGCEGLTSVEIPDSVSEIGDYAFMDCIALETVNIPTSLTTINSRVFSNCEALESIVIPANVTTIGEYAFADCISLLDITISDTLQTVDSSAFDYDIELTEDELLPRNLIIADGSTTVHRAMTSVFADQVFSVTLPEGLTSIGEEAFYSYDYLTEITLPASLTTIGADAFNSTPLTEVTIPDSVTSMDYGAFRYCSDLTDVTLPAGITEIANSMFYGCTALTSITIPENVTAIGTYAFSDTGLIAVTIPGTVKTVGENAFYSCDDLTNLILENGVTEIGVEAFYNCKALKEVTIPESITSISSDTFYYTVTEGETVSPITLHIAEGSATVTSAMTYGLEQRINAVTFPESMTSIGDAAFYDCDLLKEVVIPDTVTSIGAEAFEDCNGLTSITLPAGLQEIPASMLYGCDALRNITIPETVTTIGGFAFANCTALQEIVLPESATTLGSSIFNSCYALHSVTLPETMKAIPEYMFAYCTSLPSISIPESVESIGDAAFYGCTYLTDITMFDYVTDIGTSAFAISDSDYIACRTLNLAEGSVRMTSEIMSALRDTVNVVNLPTTITLPDTITSIPAQAFYECGELETVDLDRETVKFKADSFYACYSLYDSRFMLVDRQYVDFSANTSTATVDGLVNLTLSYRLNQEVMDEDTYTIKINLPDTVSLVYNSAAEEHEIDVSGNTVEITTSEASDTLQFSVRLSEYGTYDITAAIGFYFDDTYCEEALGAVEVKSSEISISAPSSINSNSLAVRGFAIPGQTVMIYADGAEVGTAVANTKTGKYAATVTLPTMEEEQVVAITASVSMTAEDGTTTEYTSGSVKVTYSLTTPWVESVYFNGTDITSIFTEGKKPVISINPANPYKFTISIANSDRVGQVHVISTKGGEKKYLEAHWIPEEGVWVANGYFDANNHYYVPGTLNIEMTLMDSVVIDVDKDTVEGPQSALDELFGETGTEKNSFSALEENVLSEEVLENTTAEIKYESDNAYIADVTVSNGTESEDIVIYQDNTKYVYIEGEQIPIEKVAKSPSAYGFIKSEVTVNSDGKQYQYYVRDVSGADLYSHVLQNAFDRENSGNTLSKEEVLNIPGFMGGSGAYTLQIPRDNDFVDAVDGLTCITSAMTQPIGAVFSGGRAGLWEEISREMSTLNYNGLEYLDSLRYDVAGFGWGADIFDTASKCLDVAGLAVSGYDTMKRIELAGDNNDLKFKAWSLHAGKTAAFFAKEKIAAMTTKAGAVVGNIICPGAGGFFGGIVGGIIGFAAGWFIDSKIDEWENELDMQLLAYAEDGQISYAIDPSGYVYEAVPSNRIPGATMTIYYKDADTGDEVEWTAEDYDQINPLITDENGTYAWDVPEGEWRVKFEMEGYETMYSEWMAVPPIRTNVTFNVQSTEAPALESAIANDNTVIVEFTKYMDIDSIIDGNITLYDDGTLVDCTITAMKDTEGDTYAKRFALTPTETELSKNLTVIANENCLGYNGKSTADASMAVDYPTTILALDMASTVIAAKGQEEVITVSAFPASVAAGKKLVVTDPADMTVISEEIVFDENGTAIFNVKALRTGLTELAVSVEGEDTVSIITFVSVENEQQIVTESTTTTETTTTTTESTTTTETTTTTTESTTTTETTTTTTVSTTTTETTTTTTESTTTTETTTTATESTTTSAATHIASDEELCDWAVKDYEQKTGISAENAEIEYTTDGNAVITLIDAEGNVLNVYTIDPFTGIGTESDGEEVNLPQTGYSVVYNYIMLAAAAMALLGAFLMVKSRKKEQDA